MKKLAQEIDKIFNNYNEDDEDSFQDDENSFQIFIEDKDGDGEIEPDEITFVLPEIPGAPNAEDIIIEEEESQENNEYYSDNVEEDDIWNWSSKGLNNFVFWLKNMIESVPKHSGQDTTGLEKAIAYFEAIDREITKAMRQDFKNEISSADAEKARETIENALERLIERLEKVKKTKYKRYSKKSKAWYQNEGIVKEAQKSTKINGITITVPLLISRIARVCINGVISAGHDMEDIFEQQVKEYSLDKREQAELVQLLEDMGYPIRQDRSLPIGNNNKEKNNNGDWITNYFG